MVTYKQPTVFALQTQTDGCMATYTTFETPSPGAGKDKEHRQHI
jgi:hypothetical protein